MSASNTLETSILKIMFENTSDTAWTALTGASDFYVSLHTADPTDGGDQTSNETAYTGYVRVAVARSGSGWTVTGGSAVNDGELAFEPCTASPGGNLTHVGLGLSSSGAGTLVLSGELENPIIMQVGAVPIFSVGALEALCD